jgi:hypothetical protein
VKPGRIVERHPLIEDALDAWSESLGVDRARYVGHVYRVFNFARRIVGSTSLDDTFAAASAFHDLGIWSDRTFDYLPPSVRRARSWVLAKELDLSEDLVAEVIANHHVILPIRRGVDARAVEAFRLADRVDVSAGVLRGGLDRAFVREVVRAFPFVGFHGMLARTALGWFLSHPWSPLPMLRLRANEGRIRPRP